MGWRGGSGDLGKDMGAGRKPGRVTDEIRKSGVSTKRLSGEKVRMRYRRWDVERGMNERGKECYR